MFESLNDLVDKQKDFKKKMQDQGKTAVKGALKDIFDNFPQVNAIRWTQYTPYFNDGDACTFSVNGVDVQLKNHEIDPNLDPETDQEEIDEDSWLDSYSLDSAIKDKDLKKVLVKVIKEFESAISSMEDAMEDAFGDHVRVTATRDSIEVDDYDHE